MNKGKGKFVNGKRSVAKKKFVNEKSSGPYTVIKLKEEGATLFDCIPDNWFVDEEQDRCRWPPPKGKNVAMRALKREEPDDTWEIYECEVVRGGFATYSAGRILVREKCLQNYNTSSADEYLGALKFRREHPGLSCSTLQNFEGVFATKKTENSSVVICETKNQASRDKKSSTGGDTIAEQTKQKHTEFAGDVNKKGSHEIVSFEDVQHHSVPLVSHNTEKVLSRSSTATAKYTTVCRIGSEIPSPSHEENVRKVGRRTESRSTSTTTSSENDRRPSSCSSGVSQRDKHQRASPKQRRSESRSTSCTSSGENDRSPRSCSSGVSQRNKHQSASPKQRRTESRSTSASTSSENDRSPSCDGSTLSRRTSKNRNRSSSQSESRVSRTQSTQKTANDDNYQRSISTHALSFEARNQSYSTGLRQQSPQRNRQAKRSASKRHQLSGSVRSPLIEARKQSYSTGNRQSCTSTMFDKNASSSSSFQSQNLLMSVLAEVRSLTKAVIKNQHDNDRRLSRMEVSINKTLVRIGDITRSNVADSQNVSQNHPGERLQCEVRKDAGRYARTDSPSEEQEHHRGNNMNVSRLQRHQRFPEMPIEGLNELNDANIQLRDKDFFTFMVEQEKEFTAPSQKSSHTSVITTYLKRFVFIRTRSLLTLNQNGQGFTLYADFRNIYNFLIRVMVEGYKSSKTVLKDKEAHEALRIVWGRSKQLLNDSQKKNK